MNLMLIFSEDVFYDYDFIFDSVVLMKNHREFDFAVTFL